ncbi:MAG: 2-dehydro-3-deoxygalactonokinase [Brachymonas sp.]|nr:2-dehydro-3-deoxygalactonokinase [Brachymonas sp.]
MPSNPHRFEPQAFLQGIDAAHQGMNLLNTAFSVRVKSLFKQLAPEHAASYLSGLVIGEELATMQIAPQTDNHRRRLTTTHRALQHRALAFGCECAHAGQSSGLGGLVSGVPSAHALGLNRDEPEI